MRKSVSVCVCVHALQAVFGVVTIQKQIVIMLMGVNSIKSMNRDQISTLFTKIVWINILSKVLYTGNWI
jgi:hypothetical protein